MESVGEGWGSAHGLTYDQFQGLEGPEGVPARGLAGGRQRWPPRAVLRCSRGSDWARRASSSYPRGSWLGLHAAFGGGRLGGRSSPGCCPWRTRARGERSKADTA
jgi:hypothetical protein